MDTIPIEYQERIRALEERVAYLESFLPSRQGLEQEYNTLRLSPRELNELRESIVASCTPDGIWNRPISGQRGAYPNVLRRTAFGKADVASGKRRTNAVRPKLMLEKNKVCFFVLNDPLCYLLGQCSSCYTCVS